MVESQKQGQTMDLEAQGQPIHLAGLAGVLGLFSKDLLGDEAWRDSWPGI